MNKVIQTVRSKWTNNKHLLAIAAVVASLFAVPVSSFATLSADEQAMLDAATGKITDLISAVGTLITTNITLIAAMVVGGLVIMYFKTAGR